MKRRIFMWMGLIVLFLSFGFSRETLAKEVYKVKRGDTVAMIAKKYAVSPEALKEINHLRGNSIRYKQILTIPAAEPATRSAAGTDEAKPGAKRSTAKAIKSTAPLSSYMVKKGDSIYSVAKKTGVSVSVIKRTNHLRSNALRPGRKIMLAKADQALEQKVKSAQPSDIGEEDDLGDGTLAAVSPAEVEKALATNAELVSKWHNPEEKKLFVKVATAFLGAPYRWGGVSLKGLDCSAFVKKIYELFDVSLPRTAIEQARTGATVAREDMIEGDLVFFNTKRSFGHVGIYIGNNEFVHASSGNRIVKIDNLNESYFSKRFVKAVRLKGLDEEVL